VTAFGGTERRLRLAFMGTPDFAVAALDSIAQTEHELVAVYTQPPRPTGRGYKTQASPVQLRAEALNIPVRHPISLKSPDEQAAFASLDLDVAIVAAYGLILPQAILSAPRLGCLNIHASLLPRWRGAAPIQRAILAGDTITGVTIMQMDAGLDTGAMLLRAETPITAETTAGSLHDRLAESGAGLIIDALNGLLAGNLYATPQPAEGVTYAAKLSRDEGRLDWSLTADQIDRHVRALNPAPGVWFDWNGERIKLLALDQLVVKASSAPPGTVLDDDLLIQCGTGAVRPSLLQRAGRQALDRRVFLRGTAIRQGAILPCHATN